MCNRLKFKLSEERVMLENVLFYGADVFHCPACLNKTAAIGKNQNPKHIFTIKSCIYNRMQDVNVLMSNGQQMKSKERNQRG